MVAGAATSGREDSMADDPAHREVPGKVCQPVGQCSVAAAVLTCRTAVKAAANASTAPWWM